MGEIITFYSYKGGTGRTMAVANMAVILARQTSGRVLMLDWDLEAPGLEDYFKQFMKPLNNRKGILDWVIDAQKKLPKMEFGKIDEKAEAKLLSHFEAVLSLMIPVQLPGDTVQLFLLRAGNRENDYSERVSHFDWGKLYKKIPEFFPRFAAYLSEYFDYVLIDSRTGHTDVGGICTISMPEKLVLVFTPNEQGLNGVIQLAQKAAEYRINYGGTRPLSIYPLPSRLDFSGVAQAKREWWQNDYRLRWEKAFQEIYALPPGISLQEYFDKVYIRHDSNFAFGEELAVLSSVSGGEFIQDDYKRLAVHLSFESIWKNEPFSNMEKPFELAFVFSERDKVHLKRLTKAISPLRREQVVVWNESLVIPSERWDATLERKIAGGEADVIFVLSNPKEQQTFSTEQQATIAAGSKATNVVNVPISWPDDNEIGLSNLISKPILEWADQDEAWNEVSKQLRRMLTKLYREKLNR